MKRPLFTNNRIYHIYNRGTDKRRVFLEDEDYFRFLHDLFEFNDISPAINLYYKGLVFNQPQSYEVGLRKIARKPRKLLVRILAFCLMPNHYHLLLEQLRTGGITEFMRKLGTGYTNYFNQRYKRNGVLFQGKFKAILLENDSHFVHLPYYIHLNPLDLKFPNWRNNKIENYKDAIKFLKDYRWNSFPDYIGKSNFPSVTQREFLSSFFKGPKQYEKETINWLRDPSLSSLEHLTLE